MVSGSPIKCNKLLVRDPLNTHYSPLTIPVENLEKLKFPTNRSKRKFASSLLTIDHSLFTIMKYTQHTLDKVEKILDEAKYIIRYERGTFQSGYCILEAKKVVVLNKFLQTEGRINTLFDIIPQLNISPDTLTPETRKVYEEVIARFHEEEK